MAKTIQESVAEKISKSGENVATIVIDKLAEIEINKRVDLITRSISKQDQLEKEVKKIDRNDTSFYQGGALVETMSKNRYDDIKKAKDKLTNLINNINVALDQNTTEAYIKLSETLKKLDNVGGNQKEGTTEDQQ